MMMCGTVVALSSLTAEVPRVPAAARGGRAHDVLCLARVVQGGRARRARQRRVLREVW